MKVSFFSLLGVILLASFMGCTKPVNILVVLGGHDFDTTEFFDLFHTLEGVNMDSVYYPEAMEVMQSGESDAYDVLVFYDYVPDLPEADSTVFLNLTSEGKPLLFLHHALGSFQHWDGYMEMLCGKGTSCNKGHGGL